MDSGGWPPVINWRYIYKFVYKYKLKGKISKRKYREGFTSTNEKSINSLFGCYFLLLLSFMVKYVCVFIIFCCFVDTKQLILTTKGAFPESVCIPTLND